MDAPIDDLDDLDEPDAHDGPIYRDEPQKPGGH